MSVIVWLVLSEKVLKKRRYMRFLIKEFIYFKKKQRRLKKWNLEREEKFSEEIRNEVEIDGILKVR